MPQRETLNPESWILNPGPAARAYSWFKATLFALLAWNTAVFLFSGTLSEALDATAWLVLLVLFELETGFGDRFRGGGAAAAIHGTRLAAAAAVGAAAIGYVYENEWFDAYDAALWLIALVTIEINVLRGSRRGVYADSRAPVPE